MSRTDIPPAILAWSLRRIAGDGSVEWVAQPIQASVLLDVADLLDENAKLRELVRDFFDVPCQCIKCEHYDYEEDRCDLRDRASELGIEVDDGVS